MSRALGRYELLRPLARGGMAEVFLARRRAAGVEKLLVVKRIRPERAGDVRALDLFVREARLSMSLTHQNIVPVFDFGRIDDQVFLAMERVEGKDFGSSLARAAAHPLPPLLAAYIAEECCRALDYAHHRKSPEGAPLGIVHRDVTPRNVLLSWSGEVMLTDFGIAALAGEASTGVVGTPAYMAPEQARNEPFDARADVYGLGLVLREALTGERPRPGGDKDVMLAAARAGTLLPWPPGLSEPLVAIVDRATAMAPADRYPDARAMLEALDVFIVGARAATRGDAPARQLAAWLAAVWQGARDDESSDAPVHADHLVSFLDDGALDVIGTGTEHSLAATAADAEPAPMPAPTTGAAPVASAPAAVPSKSRWPIVVATAGPLAAILAVVLVVRNTPDAPVIIDAMPDIPDRVASVVSVDAAPPVPVMAPLDAAPAPDARPPDSRTPDARTPDSRTPDARTPGQLGRPAGPPDAGLTVVDAAAIRRKVTINATPWANFTVDDDPAPHQTVENLQLTDGPHTIHFVNPQLGVSRDKLIEVGPDRDLRFVERLAP
jgi:hypothetical protein